MGDTGHERLPRRQPRSGRRQGLLFARDATAIMVAIVGLSLIPGSRFGETGDWGDALHWIGRIVQWLVGLGVVAIVAIARFPGLLGSGSQRRSDERHTRDDTPRRGDDGTGTDDERNA